MKKDMRLFEKIFKFNDDDNHMFIILNKQLNAELSKPDCEQDTELIKELSASIREILDEQEKFHNQNRMEKEHLIKKLQNKRKKILFRRITAFSVCVIMFFGLNTASMNIFGQNAFTSAYELISGRIKISWENEKIELPTSEEDPYGLKTKLAEYGIYAMTPSYIPDGFVLVDMTVEEDENEKMAIFHYRYRNMLLNFYYDCYKDNVKIPPTSIPTDTYNISQEECDSFTAYVLTEDYQFTAMWQDKRIIYGIGSIDLDYEESYKVLHSMSY